MLKTNKNRVFISNAIKYKDFISTLLNRDLKNRYFGSSYPRFWTIVSPLILSATFAFVFSGMMKLTFREGDGALWYTINVLAGLIPWIAFQDAIIRGTSCLVDNGNLVRRIPFPTGILPLISVLTPMIQMIAGVTLVITVNLLTGRGIGLGILAFPLVFLLQLIFVYGLVMSLSSLQVHLREISPVVGPAITVWMYLTPVVYPESVIPQWARPFAEVNPMHHFIRAYRGVIMGGGFPPAFEIGYLALFSFITMTIGWTIFKRLKPGFVDAL